MLNFYLSTPALFIKGMPILAGDRVGTYSIIEKVKKKTSESRWLCRCDCGKETVNRESDIFKGRIPICLHPLPNAVKNKELHKKKNLRKVIPTERSIWCGMKARCSKTSSNRDYSGRGIEVCERWLHGDGNIGGYECFLADMGPRPSSEHSIDRIDNDGNYEPSNCRWATKSQQLRNRRPRAQWRLRQKNRRNLNI